MDENVRRGYDITMKHLNFKNLCMILLGNTIYALAIVMFILPNNMITGGTTGLGIAIQYTDVPARSGCPWNEICTYNIGQYLLLSGYSGSAGANACTSECNRR